MTLTILTACGLLVTGFFAGGVGALMGVGGGIIVVPALVLFFGLDIKIAVASSLVAVVASSTAASSVYVGKGLANMRLGMLLEVATTIGGIAGGTVAVMVAPDLISAVFSVVMLLIAVLVFKSRDRHAQTQNEKPESKAQLECTTQPELSEEDPRTLAGAYYDQHSKSMVHYHVRHTFFGGVISFFAGLISGLLGVGGGFIKVPAMNLVMGVPIKVSTATSNLMIGVTAVASLFVYFTRGMVYPAVAAPVAIGVVGGALLGSRWAQKISPGVLKKIFAVLLMIVALQMFLNALGVLHG